jgi:phosphopantetheinyl transferase
MPIFFQHPVNASTRLGIWKIEETEAFFKDNVPIHRDVTHPHKRLQHMAGRFLLRYLFPDFPFELIRIADTRKPFLPDEPFHFSISHCGDYAAAIVSRDMRVGIDIEIPVQKILAISSKFISAEERKIFEISDMVPEHVSKDIVRSTLLWSAKESVFKWHGEGQLDFKKDIVLTELNTHTETIRCSFTPKRESMLIHFRELEPLLIAWLTY